MDSKGVSLPDLWGANNPLADVNQLIETISTLLMEQVRANFSLKNVNPTHPLYVTTASTLTSFVTSLITATKTETTGYIKLAMLTTPVASLVGFVSSLAALIQSLKINVTFSTKAATETISAITQSLASTCSAEAVPNSLTLVDYLHYGIGLLSMVIASGLTAFGIEAKFINTWLSMTEHVEKLGNNIEGFIKNFAEKILKVDLTNDAVYTNHLQSVLTRMDEMLQTPATEFITDQSKSSLLTATINDITALTKTKLNPDQQRKYNGHRSLLNSGYLKLVETAKIVKQISDSTLRQDCFGLVLQGPPGVGKSELAHYIFKKLAHYANYCPAVYNCKPGSSGDFFEIYGGQQFGIYNEFCAARQDKQGIAKINEMISSDPCNLEGAHLDYKHQPCKLACVILTANKKSNEVYDFTTQITEEANIALMTRLTRIHVEDPNFEGREGSNEHRTDDFSHLKLYELKPRKPAIERTHLSDYADNEKIPITMEKLLMRLLDRLLANERRYIQKILDTCATLTPELRSNLLASMRGKRPDLDFAEPNSTRGVPFVLRLQGPPHTGKTQNAQHIAGALSTCFDIPIHKVTSLAAPPHDGVGIFLLDDLSESEITSDLYVQWINAVHKKSIVILMTNYSVPIKQTGFCSFRRLLQSFCAARNGTYDLIMLSFWIDFYQRYMHSSESYFDTTSFSSCPPGLVRRLGLSGLSYDGKQFSMIPGNGLCITTSTSWETYVNTERVINPDIVQLAENAYFSHLRQVSDFTVVHANPPQATADITVTIRDFDIYAQSVTSFSGCLDMFMESDHPGASITVTPEKRAYLLKAANMRAWVMPSPPQESTLLASIRPFILRLSATCPSTTLRLVYKDISMFYKDHILYSTLNFDRTVENVNGRLFVSGSPIPPGILSLVYTRGLAIINEPQFSAYTGHQLVSAVNYMQQNYAEESLALYRAAIEVQQSMLTTAQTTQKMHPLIRFFEKPSRERTMLICLGGVIAGLTTAFGLYKLISYVVSSNEPEAEPNQQTPPDSLSKKRSQEYKNEYVAHVMKGGSRSSFISEKISQGESPTRMSKWDHYQRKDAEMNSATAAQIAAARSKIANVFTPEQLTKFDELVASTNSTCYPNNVHYADVISQELTMFDNLEKALRRATLRVDCNGGCNYGLLLKDNFFITVAHAGLPGLEMTVLWTPDDNTPANEYPACIISRDSSRDIMLCQITAKAFPPAKDITTHIISLLDKRDWSSNACYIRSVPGGSRYFGTASYHGKRSVPLKGSVPDWAPDDYITYNSYSTSGLYGVHRRGDCGLPLTTCINNKAFVVGIHNSVNHAGGGNFSPLYREELIALMASDTIPNSATVLFSPPTSTLPGFESSKLIPDYSPLLKNLRPVKAWGNHPEIPVLGYAHELKFFSQPRFSKRLVHGSQNRFPVMTKPSPINELTAEAVAFLPKDTRGRALPLLAQTKKYFVRRPYNVDQQTAEWARDMHNNMLKAYIGEIRMLRTFEVINGIPDGNLKPVDMHTSAGPYFKAMFKITTKQQLFSNYNQHDPTKPAVYGFSATPAGEALAHQLSAISSTWGQCQSVVLFIKDNPKVELLPIEDVNQEGKLRLFCELDVAANLAFREILGDYISKCHQFHHQLPSRLGFNPYTFPQSYMAEFSDNEVNIATDIKRLDKNYPAQLIEEFFMALFELAITNDHKARLVGASKTLAKTVRIQDGILYTVEGSNPSGIVGTTPLNCFLGDRIAMYIFITAMNKAGLRDHLHFSSFIRMTGLATYGDDQNWRLARNVPITLKEIQEGFLAHGLEIVPSKNFPAGSTEFCSRQIVHDKEHCIWFSRLKQESIIQSLYWLDVTRKELIPPLFLSILFEASLWPESFFNDVRAEIMTQAKQLSISPLDLKLFSYASQRRHFASYLRGEVRSPIITEMETDICDQSPFEQTYNFEKRYTMPHYLFAYHDACKQERDETPIKRIDTTRVQTIEDSRVILRVVNLYHGEHQGEGIDPDLSEALRAAYQDLYYNRFGQPPNHDTVFSEPNSTEITLRYTENTAADYTGRNWALHTNGDCVASGFSEIDTPQTIFAQPDVGRLVEYAFTDKNHATVLTHIIAQCPQLRHVNTAERTNRLIQAINSSLEEDYDASPIDENF